VFGKVWGQSIVASTAAGPDELEPDLVCPPCPDPVCHPGDPQNAELAQLKAGSLFLVRPDSIKGSRECM
jgi:hypothetical protein